MLKKPCMRIKRLVVSSSLITEHFGVGSKAYTVINGIPSTAKLRDVRLANGGRLVEFLYEHESFSALEANDKWDAPHIKLTLQGVDMCEALEAAKQYIAHFAPPSMSLMAQIDAALAAVKGKAQ